MVPVVICMSERRKRRTYEILTRTEPRDTTTRVVNIFTVSLIVINVVAFVLSTYQNYYAKEALAFIALVLFSLVVFTAEYLLLVWSCTLDPRFRDPIRGRLRFMATPVPLLTLLVIGPLWLGVIFQSTAVRAAFLILLFRLFAQTGSFRVLKDVVKVKRSDLGLALLIDIIVLLIASTLMYWVESPVNSKMQSIPATIWWGTQTLTTVGYGDVVPVTPLGKLLGVVVMFAGIATFALPISVIGAGFLEVRQKRTPDSRHTVEEPSVVFNHVRKLGELRDENLLTEEEFQSKKKELLAKL